MVKRLEALSLKDWIGYVLLGLGLAVQWGVFTARVNAQDERLGVVEKKVDTLGDIKSDLNVLKEATLDSRQRIVRIENKLLR